MNKYKIILILILLIYPFLSYSHITHYNKIKFIEMDVLRNGKKVGFNKYIFIKKKDLLLVKNEISFLAKFMGVKLMNISGSSIEKYKNGELVEFKSNTTQNKKKKFNSLVLDRDRKFYKIKGSSFTGKAPLTAVVGHWWNHNILNSNIIISPLSGSLKNQEVYFLSKEILKIGKNFHNTSKFKIILKKNIEDKKKEEFYVWFDDRSKIILKVTYSKFGNWEYLVKTIKGLN